MFEQKFLINVRVPIPIGKLERRLRIAHTLYRSMNDQDMCWNKAIEYLFSDEPFYLKTIQLVIWQSKAINHNDAKCFLCTPN